MNRIKRNIITALFTILPLLGVAQQYTGMTGLIHTPTADMNQEGDVRLGGHFLNKAMTPDTGFIFKGEKYNTYDYYLSLTPYNWIELSLTCTKRLISRPGDAAVVYGAKDRYFSVKIRPIKETKYVPAIAVGMNDVGTTAFNPNRSNSQLYFTNYYIAATKHFTFNAGTIGANLAYRQYFRSYNDKWSGLVGAVTFSPAIAPTLRAIVEYTGNEMQVGFDALICKHLLVQASLKDFKYPNFGVCFQMNLFGANKKNVK